MSSSPLPSNEATSEGQGYVDDEKEPSAFLGSSILGSAASGDQGVEGADIVLEIDATREWTNFAPPPTVSRYD